MKMLTWSRCPLRKWSATFWMLDVIASWEICLISVLRLTVALKALSKRTSSSFQILITLKTKTKILHYHISEHLNTIQLKHKDLGMRTHTVNYSSQTLCVWLVKPYKVPKLYGESGWQYEQGKWSCKPARQVDGRMRSYKSRRLTNALSTSLLKKQTVIAFTITLVISMLGNHHQLTLLYENGN